MYQKPSVEKLGSFRELTQQISGSQCSPGEKTIGAGDIIYFNQSPIGEGGCIS